MSRNTKSHNNKDVRRRSALSFIGGDGSLDIDDILQSEPWKNVEKFKNSEAGCIQNMLDDFVKIITQENTVESNEGLLKIIKGDIPAKKTPRSTKGSTKSPIKDLLMDLPGTSSSTNSNIVETNTTVNKNKTLKRQNWCEISEMEMIPQELSYDTNDVKEEIQNISEAKENVDSNKKMSKKKILQDITNITEENLYTSTPKKVKKTVKKKESTAENKKPKTENSKNKSGKNIQRKEIQKKSKNTNEQAKSSANIFEEEEKPNVKLENNSEEIISQELSRNTDDAKEETKKSSKATAKKNVNSDKKIKKEIVQDTTNSTEENLQTSTSKKEASKIRKKKVKKEESTANKKSKTENSENKSEKNVQRKKIQKKSKSTKEQGKSSVNMLEEEKKMNVNLKNNLECNKVNQNSSKNKIENKKVKSSATLLSEIEKKYEVAEINNNMEKVAKSKEYNKSMSNQLKEKNLKKKNPENKLQRSAQLRTSLKSSQINNTKCQCEKSSAKCSDNQCSLKAKEDYEKRKERKKSLKAAKAIEGLSRHITVVKRKMECIKNDLAAMTNVRENNGKNKSVLRCPLNQTKMKLHEKKESGIHRIQEVPLEELDLSKEYNVEKTLGEGSFAKVLLATHRTTQTRVVLKAVHQELTSEKDFFREFHYSYHLSPHPNILCSYAVAFKAEKCFVFAQEYAPYGDLAGNVKAGGLNEDACKKIAGQLASALDFIHSKQLAHRDIKLENVLVFAQDMSKVKLCDFGCTKREGTLVNKIRCTWVPFQPPEIHEIIKNERYACKRSSDCWQFGIVLFVCLTGNPPWQSADPIQDPDYSAFQRWLKRRTTKIPPTFRRFTPRLLRYFRRAFEHKPEKRPHVTEINKYLKDSWCISKISHSATSTSVDVSESLARRGDSLLYLDTILDDRHNVDENKNKLRKLLNSYGLETTVDQKVVTKRIWEWVMQCDSNIDTEPGLISSFSTEDM
ncbi:Serine/threonine-protein kinase SBK1 [Trachymyrmex zeteki]|nr:Serine/threonine-protein kinase SBK1 [Trachymyrmex zeteki]